MERGKRAIVGKNTDRLWEFSYKVYGHDGMEKLFLELQDEREFDVNLLLFCLWYGAHHGRLAPALLSEAVAFSAHWRTQKVEPLRRLRRRMKQRREHLRNRVRPVYARLRERVKACELEAERRQQRVLEQLAARYVPLKHGDTARAINANLAALTVHMGSKVDRELRAHFSRLVEVAVRLACPEN